MPTLSSAQGTVELVALFLLLLPLGSVLIRLGEWVGGRRIPLLVIERLLLSFFASGGLLFVVASIPLPIYGLPAVAGLLVAGAVAFVVLAVRNRAQNVRAAVEVLLSWPMLAVGAGSLGLLVLEVVSGSLLLPNGIDGAVHALFTTVILQNHMIPSTLAPFAADGVIYPLGAPVWMTVPVLLFGWPVVSAPVLLPPLFASLSVTSGFCLGERLAPDRPGEVPWTGLLFAAFFGLVASWPRLYVGGSYDFIFALPMFVVGLGLLRDYVRSGVPTWRAALAAGIFLGSLTALSAAAGVALVLLLAVWIVVFPRRTGASVGAAMLRWFVTVGVAALFVGRSIAEVAVWFGYPGHVLTPTGRSPVTPLITGSVYGGWVEQLDPFVPFKWKVSPVPVVSVELQLLLVVGIVLSAWVLARPRSAVGRYLSPGLVEWVVVSVLVLFAETSFLLVLGMANTSLSGIQSVTNVWETSVLLFLFYQLVALLPLLAATNVLRARAVGARSTPSLPSPPRREHVARERQRTSAGPALAAVVILVTLGVGGGTTVVAVPGYLHSYLTGQANATSSDVAALEWAADHLPSCSKVFVAPGSAAQFLPEYAVLSVVYPTFPYPTNESYVSAVHDLSAGAYSNVTRDDLLDLGVTEVFVTGATTNTFPPFRASALEGSSDFSPLFGEGDASIFEFLDGVAASGCDPAG